MNLYEGQMALQELKILLEKSKFSTRDKDRMCILALRISNAFTEIEEFKKNVVQITEMYDRMLTSVTVEPQREVRNKRKK